MVAWGDRTKLELPVATSTPNRRALKTHTIERGCDRLLFLAFDLLRRHPVTLSGSDIIPARHLHLHSPSTPVRPHNVPPPSPPSPPQTGSPNPSTRFTAKTSSQKLDQGFLGQRDPKPYTTGGTTKTGLPAFGDSDVAPAAAVAAVATDAKTVPRATGVFPIPPPSSTWSAVLTIATAAAAAVS